MKLSEKLRLLREEKGMTQEQVCKKLEIGIQTLRNYENDNADRLPNTYQLNKIKNFYNVTYEYLLDDNCENKTAESVDIGKILCLSDKSIERLKDLQRDTYSFSPDIIKDYGEDKKSPISFSLWIEHFSDLHDFTRMLNEFYLLNDLIEDTKYFSTIMDLTSYIIFCLNENKSMLASLFKLLDEKINHFKNCVTNYDYTSLNYHNYEELNDNYLKLKSYCNSYKKNSKKNTIKNIKSTVTMETDSELYYILNDILEIGIEYYEIAYKELRFCHFEILEFLKNSLNCPENQISIPQEYKKMKKLINMKEEIN